jgi:hypothetical protein
VASGWQKQFQPISMAVRELDCVALAALSCCCEAGRVGGDQVTWSVCQMVSNEVLYYTAAAVKLAVQYRDLPARLSSQMQDRRVCGVSQIRPPRKPSRYGFPQQPWVVYCPSSIALSCSSSVRAKSITHIVVAGGGDMMTWRSEVVQLGGGDCGSDAVRQACE